MPSSITLYPFNNVAKENCTLKVPHTAVSAYNNAYGWKEFNIIGLKKKNMEAKNMLLIVCMQLPFAMGSCKKPPTPQTPAPKPPIEQATDSSILSIVWSRPFQSDSISVSFIDPFFAGDYIVFASQGFNDMETPPADIYVFHKLTGELHSSWQRKHIPTNGLFILQYEMVNHVRGFE